MYEIIIERMKGLESLINEKFDNLECNNTKEHDAIVAEQLELKKNQVYTNGKVMRHEIFQERIKVLVSVLILIMTGIAFPLLVEYLK